MIASRVSGTSSGKFECCNRSIDEWNSVKETEYLTSSPEMMDWLRKAEENMNAGKGTTIDIDAL